MNEKTIGKKAALRSSFSAGFVLNFVLVFFVYSALLQHHFSPDTFDAYAGQHDQIYWHISLGRFVHGIVYHALLNAGLGIIDHLPAYTFIFMGVSAWCAARVADGLCRAARREENRIFFLCDFAFLISVVNICMLEWYLFPECMVMYAIALLGAVEGALAFAQSGASLPRRAVVSFVWLFLGVNSYQAILGWYAALALIIILASSDFCITRRSFIVGAAVVAIAGVNSVLNQAIVKLLSAAGLSDTLTREADFALQDFAFRAKAIFDSQKLFLRNGYYLLPHFFLFLSFAAGVALLFVSFSRWRVRRFLSVGVALGTGYLLTLLPHLLSVNVRITPRTIPAVFLILSVLLALCMLSRNRAVVGLSVLLTAAVLLVGGRSMSRIISDHMLTIHTDIHEGRSILREIERREEETGVQIEEICVLHDADVRICYPGVTTTVFDINLRHLIVEWEVEPFLEQLSGRDFTFVHASRDEADAIVRGRNWDYPDYEEQISFDKNRAYVILY